MQSDARKPTYEQLSGLCAQMAAALERNAVLVGRFREGEPAARGKILTHEATNGFAAAKAALTAYRTLSPDPQWQRVPEGCVVVPVDPGHEMINAAVFRAEQTSKKGTAMLRSAFSSIYQAFVQAAPNRARGEG